MAMANGVLAWTLVSSGLDAALVVEAFSPSLPRSGRLVVKGDQVILETHGGNGNPLSRVRLAPPAAKGSMPALTLRSASFGSLLVVEEETGERSMRHLYQVVVCIIPMERPEGST